MHHRDLNPLLGGGVRTAQLQNRRDLLNRQYSVRSAPSFSPHQPGLRSNEGAPPARLRVWQFGRKIHTSCGCILKSLMCS
jgi:hypothetical protein